MGSTLESTQQTRNLEEVDTLNLPLLSYFKSGFQPPDLAPRSSQFEQPARYRHLDSVEHSGAARISKLCVPTAMNDDTQLVLSSDEEDDEEVLK